MAGLSDYYENIVIDHLFRAQEFTPPSTIYVGLFTAAPTDAGGGTEVSGGGYARQAVTFSAASGGSTSNNAAINFPTATASWGTVVAFGLFDASTGGNLLAWDNLATSKAIGSGDQAVFSTGNLTLTVD
jgi:hypothetical protein